MQSAEIPMAACHQYLSMLSSESILSIGGTNVSSPTSSPWNDGDFSSAEK